MLDSELILSNLKLHLRLVFFEVCESLLQIYVFLSLGSHGLVEEFGIVLDYGHDLLQVVVVEGLQVSLH